MMEPEFVLKVHQNELLSLKSQMNLRRENVSCSARKLVEFCLDMTPKVRLIFFIIPSITIYDSQFVVELGEILYLKRYQGCA